MREVQLTKREMRSALAKAVHTDKRGWVQDTVDGKLVRA